MKEIEKLTDTINSIGNQLKELGVKKADKWRFECLDEFVATYSMNVAQGLVECCIIKDSGLLRKESTNSLIGYKIESIEYLSVVFYPSFGEHLTLGTFIKEES